MPLRRSMSSFRWLVPLCLAACGEPAYYPDVAVAVDTGFVEVPLACGVVGTPVPQTVEIRNTLDRGVRVMRVDAACLETTLATLMAFETRSFVISDVDGLAGYVVTPEGDVRVAARAPVPGLDMTGWVVP